MKGDKGMIYDVAIIGAGVIGSMIARELGLRNLSACVIEAEADVASGASRANSGIVHAGFDAEPGSLKARMNKRGNEMMATVVRELGVSYDNCGSLVVAFDDADEKHLDGLMERGAANGVPVEKISGEQARRMEPALSCEIISALWAPTAGIVDPFSLTIGAIENAMSNGVTLYLNSRVTAIEWVDGVWELFAGDNRIRAHWLINAAGVYADDISRMAGGESFGIRARRGQYVLFDKNMPVRTKAVIFGAPSDKGKGVLFSPTAHVNMIAGPTAEFVDKDNNDTTREGLLEALEGVKRYAPEVDKRHAITVFAGLRAMPETHDFIIERSAAAPTLINVAGIESPGLTSSPAIAEYVKELLAEAGLRLTPKPGAKRVRPAIERFAEATPERQRELIAMDKRYANVVCRCEQITEAEIVESIHRPCGAKTVDGVRLRIRAGAGRCHGGFCMPRVMAILARELCRDLCDISKSGEGSWILDERIKEETR
jgi:glycerol-3-phosphate dehydrogenase